MTIEPLGSAGRIPEWTVRDRLRKAREDADMGQAELALRTGISRATISSVENGHKPSKTVMRLWALATGVPIEWLATGCTPRDLNPEPTDYGFRPRPIVYLEAAA